MNEEERQRLKNAYREALLGGGWPHYRNLFRTLENYIGWTEKDRQGVENLRARRKAEGHDSGLEGEVQFFPPEISENLHLSEGAIRDKEKYEEEKKKSESS